MSNAREHDEFWQRVKDFYNRRPDMDPMQNPRYWDGLEGALTDLYFDVRAGEQEAEEGGD